MEPDCSQRCTVTGWEVTDTCCNKELCQDKGIFSINRGGQTRGQRSSLSKELDQMNPKGPNYEPLPQIIPLLHGEMIMAVFILFCHNKFDHIDKSKLSSLALQTSLGTWKMRLPRLCLVSGRTLWLLKLFPHPAPCPIFALQMGPQLLQFSSAPKGPAGTVPGGQGCILCWLQPVGAAGVLLKCTPVHLTLTSPYSIP